MKEIRNPSRRTVAGYGVITLGIWVMVMGICFFKFPNHFASGGVTGFSTVVNEVTRWSAGGFTSIINTLLLLPGSMFLGKGFGIGTVYTSILMSFTLSLLERVYPLARPLTDEPLLGLMFVIFLPAVDTAILFNLGASSGGTGIITVVLKKHTSLNIGTVLMLVDAAAVASSFFVFGPKTGLFSTIRLATKSLVIDSVIQNLNLCKYFNIICDDSEPIYGYIINAPHRSATVYHAQEAFSHNGKTVIMTAMKRSQTLKLRNCIRGIGPTTFMLISDSNEIIRKEFLAN